MNDFTDNFELDKKCFVYCGDDICNCRIAYERTMVEEHEHFTMYYNYGKHDPIKFKNPELQKLHELNKDGIVDHGRLNSYHGLDIKINTIVERYDTILKNIPGVGEPKCEGTPGTSYEHLRYMLSEISKNEMEWGKLNRWLGFVQGIMVVRGLLTVEEERNFTRPILSDIRSQVTIKDNNNE